MSDIAKIPRNSATFVSDKVRPTPSDTSDKRKERN